MCFRFAGDNKLFPQDVDKIFKRVGKNGESEKTHGASKKNKF